MGWPECPATPPARPDWSDVEQVEDDCVIGGGRRCETHELVMKKGEEFRAQEGQDSCQGCWKDMRC